MEQNRLIIDLQLPIYLYKFLTKKFGENYKASETEHFGLLILRILSRKTESKYVTISKPGTYQNYSISIGIRKAEEYGFFINHKNINKIISAIDDYFRDVLFSLIIINHRNFEIDYKITMLKFLEEFEIEEDEISFESLYKDFYRKKILQKIIKQ